MPVLSSCAFYTSFIHSIHALASKCFRPSNSSLHAKWLYHPFSRDLSSHLSALLQGNRSNNGKQRRGHNHLQTRTFQIRRLDLQSVYITTNVGVEKLTFLGFHRVTSLIPTSAASWAILDLCRIAETEELSKFVSPSRA